MAVGNNQLPYNFDKSLSRRHGKFCVCLRDKDRKNSVNSASVKNVCARAALTDSSSDKQQLQGTIIILRNFFHIQFFVVAWEMEDKNKTTCLIF